ncbi:MAG TPA: hypothetical protein VLM05_05020 [Mycobacteriales bacterium]|nr:hypothetical protein [Mycobacteriales bacterium]
MKLHRTSVAAAAAAAAVVLSAVAAPAAFASGKGGGGGGGGGGGRPGGDGVSTAGVGTLGSPWTLKSKHDDDGPGPVAGEEFEIDTPLGHVWTVTFADNGQPFFGPQDVAATATGVRAMGKATDTGTEMIMSVHAVDTATGEVIDGAVDLPAL